MTSNIVVTSTQDIVLFRFSLHWSVGLVTILSAFHRRQLAMVWTPFPEPKVFFLACFALLMSKGVNSMSGVKKAMSRAAVKDGFHIRNKHRTRYDFQFLKSANPDLTSYIAVNKYGDESIEFSNPLAVTALNKVNNFSPLSVPRTQ